MILTKTGAHITIFARRQGPLDEAKDEILAARLNEDQDVNAVSLDLADASKVILPALVYRKMTTD